MYNVLKPIEWIRDDLRRRAYLASKIPLNGVISCYFQCLVLPLKILLANRRRRHCKQPLEKDREHSRRLKTSSASRPLSSTFFWCGEISKSEHLYTNARSWIFLFLYSIVFVRIRSIRNLVFKTYLLITLDYWIQLKRPHVLPFEQVIRFYNSPNRSFKALPFRMRKWE